MRAYLDLVRIFLTPTALADSWAGFFIAWYYFNKTDVSFLESIPYLLATLLISVLLYSFGMVTNDLFDVKRDRERSIPRPLVKGQASLIGVILVSLLLLGLGMGTAIWIDIWPIAGAIVGSVLLYNVGGKRIPVIGNLLMGSCRGLNFLLGAEVALMLMGNSIMNVEGTIRDRLFFVILVPAAITTLYIAGITAISLLEDKPYSRIKLKIGIKLLELIPFAILVWGFNLNKDSGWPLLWASLAFIGFMIYLSSGLKLPEEKDLKESDPHPAELFVRHGLGGIYFLNLTFLLSSMLFLPCLGVFSFYLLGARLKKWWFSGLKPKAS